MDKKQQLYYNELKTLAESQGWILKSDRYVSSSEHVILICPKGHERSITPNAFKQKKTKKGGCAICSGKCSKTAEANFWRNLEEIGAIRTEESVYTNALKPVKFLCSEGHQCNSTPANLQQGHVPCKICTGHDEADSERRFRETLKEIGWEILSPYRGCKGIVELQCDKGHLRQMAPSTITRGVRCGACAGNDASLFAERSSSRSSVREATLFWTPAPTLTAWVR